MAEPGRTSAGIFRSVQIGVAKRFRWRIIDVKIRPILAALGNHSIHPDIGRPVEVGPV